MVEIILMQTCVYLHSVYYEGLVERSNQDSAQGIFLRHAIQSCVLNFNSKGSPSQVEKVLLTHMCAI